MKIVGIIGPYFSGGNRRLIEHNIANAQYVAIEIANYFSINQLVGFFAPHTHTARFEKLTQAPGSYYHALDEEIYNKVCEAFVVLPEYHNSQGSLKDMKRARDQGKTIFVLGNYDIASMRKLVEALRDWALEK